MDKLEIKQNLIDLSDKKYKKFHSKLCPGINNILGIRVPILRKYAKELGRRYDLQYILNNIDTEYYEEIMLKGMIIGLSKNIEETIKFTKLFVLQINNWAICDTFCAGLKITNKNKEKMWRFIQEYLKSKNEFELRFAIVIILDYFIEEKYLKKDFEIFENIKSKDYYVQMAIAWAISFCLIKYYDETVKYLETSNLDNFTYNKAIQKAIESYRINENKKLFLKGLKK